MEEIFKQLPDNMPLYKDSGRWQLRSDDMEEVIIQQQSWEAIESFLDRCVDYNRMLQLE